MFFAGGFYNEGPEVPIVAVTLSHNGMCIAGVTEVGAVLLYHILNGRRVNYYEDATTDSPGQLAFSPKLEMLAVGFNNSPAKVLEVHPRCENFALVTTLSIESRDVGVPSVAWSSDGHWLAGANTRNTVTVWDCTNEFSAVWTISVLDTVDPVGPVHLATELAFTADSSWLVFACGSVIRTWNMRGGPHLKDWEGWKPMDFVKVSPYMHAPQHVFSSVDGIRDFRIVANDDAILQYGLCGKDDHVTDVAFRPDGKNFELAFAANSLGIMTFKAPYAKPETYLSMEQDGKICAVAYSFTSSFIATGKTNGTVEVWERDSMQVVALLRSHTDRITKLLFAMDDQRLVSLSADGTCRVWDLHNSTCDSE